MSGMILTAKIRLKPTAYQETYFRKASGTARWAYNLALSESEFSYQSTGKKTPENEIRKQITQLKKQEEYSWLSEVSAQIPKQAVKDLDTAYKRFYRGLSSKPQFKTKRNSDLSFFAREDQLKVTKTHIFIDKLGWVKHNKDTRGIEKASAFSNPRVKFDGKYWYITVSVKLGKPTPSLTEEVLGIDLGISRLAYLSNGKYYPNINYTRVVKRLEKRLRRLQRRLSRKYEMNKQGSKFIKTQNIIKLEKKVRLLHRRLTNIRQDYLHKTTTEIVKTKPSQIVIEDLNIKQMLKNKHLSKKIQEQKLYEFIRQLTYKCELHSIQLSKADRYFPSSKRCSDCKSIKLNLKLADRTFKCPVCGLVIDRDYNAALNLALLV